MNVLELHNKAMDLSNQARVRWAIGDEESSHYLYLEAAKYERQVVEFYDKRDDVNKTKSIFLRSAAFLSLKAGLTEDAYRFAVRGLEICEEDSVREQLYAALEHALRFRGQHERAVHSEFNYMSELRRRSVEYILESESGKYSRAITTKSAIEFLSHYEKGLTAFASAEYKRAVDVDLNYEDVKVAIRSELEPLIVNAGNGSLRITIGTHWMAEVGERQELTEIRSTVVKRFNDEILSVTYSDDVVQRLKGRYTPAELTDMVTPVVKIRSNRLGYRVKYQLDEAQAAIPIVRISNKLRATLVPKVEIPEQVNKEIEQVLMLKRTDNRGVTKSEMIARLGSFKNYAFDYPLVYGRFTRAGDVQFNEPVVVHVEFTADDGFEVLLPEMDMAASDRDSMDAALVALMRLLEKEVLRLRQKTENEQLDESEQARWAYVNRVIGNPSAI
jgi:hypothetical protein